MRPEGWPKIIAEAWAEVRAESLTRGDGNESRPDRVIEYEVEEHPWASEEGCAPRIPGLEEAPAAALRRMTQEQAAMEAGCR